MIYNPPYKREIEYLKFAAPASFSIEVSHPVWEGIIEYSYDQTSWSEWIGTAITGTEIYFRGKGNTQVSMDIDEIEGASWSITGSNVSCSGNIEMLLDYQQAAFGKHPEMADYCYCSMFILQTALISAPKLPAPKLTDFCYAAMFYGCANLETTPELIATKLADYCYYAMFSNCTALKYTYSLPATILTQHCYDGLFENCYNLICLPRLPATTLMPSCYRALFYYCSNFKFSSEPSEGITQEYRVPTEGTATIVNDALTFMISGTGGKVTNMNLNTTFYVSDDVIIV